MKKNKAMAVAILTTVTSLGIAHSAAAENEQFLPPFDPIKLSTVVAAPTGDPCAAISKGKFKTIPPAITKMSIPSKYGDDGKTRDDIDEDAENDVNKAMAPFREFGQSVSSMANSFTRTGKVEYAQCALQWLNLWQDGDAMTDMDAPTGQTTANSEFERAQIMSGLALSLVQIQPAVIKDKNYNEVVKWMVWLAKKTVGYYSAAANAAYKGTRNNHLYWAMLDVATVGVLSKDSTVQNTLIKDEAQIPLFVWSARRFQIAMQTADARGTLPLELERGTRALQYHLFALQPLTPMALMLARNNFQTVLTTNNWVFNKIVEFSLASIAKPGTMTTLVKQKMAELKQTCGDNNQCVQIIPQQADYQQDLSFVPAFQAAFASSQSPQARSYAKQGPFCSSVIGGNQMLLYPSDALSALDCK